MEDYKLFIKQSCGDILSKLVNVLIDYVCENINDGNNELEDLVVGQKEGIEMLLDTAGIYKCKAEKIHESIELIDDIIASIKQPDDFKAVDNLFKYINSVGVNHISVNCHKALSDLVLNNHLCETNIFVDDLKRLGI